METWINASKALSLLKVRPQTLYANVSRGKIRTKQSPNDGRKSLYHFDDIVQLSARKRGQRKLEDVALQATVNGLPIMSTSISTIVNGTLFYRDKNAVDLSKGCHLEDIASHLWQCDKFQLSPSNITLNDNIFDNTNPIEKLTLEIAANLHLGPFSKDQDLAALKENAKKILGQIIHILFSGIPNRKERKISQIASEFWSAPEAEEDIRYILCLLADHELNASTFANRVVISTGASLNSGILAALSALNGPLHGNMYIELNKLISRTQQIGVESAIKERLDLYQSIPGFSHPLYPQGDIRCKAILNRLPVASLLEEIKETTYRLTGEEPNIDFALVYLVKHYNLPLNSPIYLYIAARTVGWLAHSIEQASMGKLIRPRAKYKTSSITH